MRKSVEKEIAAYDAADANIESPVAGSDSGDDLSQKTAVALEKITLRDEIALADLKLAALPLGSIDEIKEAQDEIHKQNHEIEAVQDLVRAGLDELRSDLSLVRSLKAGDPGGVSESFLREIAAVNRSVRKDLKDFQQVQKQYAQAAEQVKKQPKNDQLASKAGALGRRKKTGQARLEKTYRGLLEKTEQRLLAVMVDFTEYLEYLGRTKDRYNRAIGFLIVYEPVPEKDLEGMRKQLLESRVKLAEKLSESRVELSDEDEVIFFRRQILGRLLGQAPEKPRSLLPLGGEGVKNKAPRTVSPPK